MSGAIRLIICLFGLALLAAVVVAQDGQSPKVAPSTTGGSVTLAKPPAAKVQVVEDVINGHKIDDPYRWMENSESPDTQAYVREQLTYTRSVLDPLPGRDKIHARLSQLLSIGSIGVPQIGGNYYFHTRRDGMQNQPVLYVREGANGKDRVLLDVNALAADGTIALDWWYCSHDGKLVAYGTSPSGSEISTLHLIDTASGKLLPDTIERTRAASIAFKLDNSGFYYTRYPKKGDVPEGQEMYNRHVFYHAMGTDPEKDELVFGKGRDPQDWPSVALSNDGRWLLIIESQGWTKAEVYIKDVKANTPFVPVVEGKNFLYDGEVYNGDIYIHTNEDAPRYRVFRVAATDPKRENWKEIIPQTDAVLTGGGIIHGDYVAQYEKNATSQLKIFKSDGKFVSDIALPALGTVFGTGGNWDSKDAFYGFQSFTFAPSIYRFEFNPPGTLTRQGKPAPFMHITPPHPWEKVAAPVDPVAYKIDQVWYTSKDGTKVPMFVVSKKGLALNGHNPTLLTGYGGFNISNTPVFLKSQQLWLEHGGVWALANLRGGSEFGEDWHRAGMLEKKQNVFDDFIAAAEYLIAQKYTDSDHLAIQGGSNGGLLVGVALTQRPDLYRAVICQVPLLDMLRYQNFQIAKLWIPEYGSSDDPKQFDYLYAYSPYHHVKDGVKYPAVLFMTADTDTRVDPMHAKKMAARLQAANGGDRPILLRIEPKAGHGAGKPITKLIEEATDIYSFLFWQLGVTP